METLMATGFAHPELIVETDWLARHMDDPKVCVVDCTTHLLPRPGNVLYDIKPGREEFERAHIPGAVFLDMDREVSAPHPVLHFMLPEPDAFSDAMARLGIGDDTLIVSYSTANHWWATRLWWMLRVFGHERAAVLNGGFQKWQSEGRALQAGPSAIRPRAQFTSRYHPEYVANKDEVRAAIGVQNICTVNALRPEQHAGTGGTSYGRLGHISGSVNIAAVQHIGPDNCLKPSEELRRIFAPALAAPQVITYCGGGIAATSVALVLTMFGHPDVKVYDASLTEWAADPSLPMET